MESRTPRIAVVVAAVVVRRSGVLSRFFFLAQTAGSGRRSFLSFFRPLARAQQCETFIKNIIIRRVRGLQGCFLATSTVVNRSRA